MIFDYTRDKAASSILPRRKAQSCRSQKDANKYSWDTCGEEGNYFFDFSSSCTSEAITGFKSSRVTACITSGLSFDNTLATIASTSVCVAVGCVEATSAADKSEITVANASEEPSLLAVV